MQLIQMVQTGKIKPIEELKWVLNDNKEFYTRLILV